MFSNPVQAQLAHDKAALRYTNNFNLMNALIMLVPFDRNYVFVNPAIEASAVDSDRS